MPSRLGTGGPGEPRRSTEAKGRQRPARGALPAAVAALVLAACGGSGGGATPAPSPSGAASPTAAATTAAPTPAPTPAGPTLIVWVVGAGGGAAQVRTVPIGGGTVKVVASLPAGATVLAAGFGRLAAAYPDHTIHVLDLAGGGDRSYPAVAGADMVYGGALSPDGGRLAFDVARSSPPGGSLQVLDLVTGSTTLLRAFDSTSLDVPARWTAGAMAGTGIVAFADAGPQALVRLDPTSGVRTATTDVTGSGPVAISPDGLHAAASSHSGLGDDGDSPGGPGPAQPFNTLRAVTIGTPPATLTQEAHHQITPLAVSASGDTICYFDDTAGGAFAGITLSSQFGLFLRSGSTTTQLVHWDSSRWDAGVFVGSAVAVADHTSAAERLELASAGGAPAVLDTVSGGDAPVFVGTA